MTEISAQKKRQIVRRAKRVYLRQLEDHLLLKFREWGMFNRDLKVDINSFEVVWDTQDLDREDLKDTLQELFGASVEVADTVYADGCCEICYEEFDAIRFTVSNQPHPQLAGIAP